MKKVSILTENEVTQVKELYKNGKTPRLRMRSHVILLSNDNHTVNHLVKIFGFTEKTVCSIINNYNEKKIAGLFDQPRSGRPTALTEEEETFVLKMVAIDSRNLNKILNELKNKFDKIICKQTLIRFLKKKIMFGSVFVNH